MKRHWNRKGFTLAEVLIVVAIVIVLAGVGFVALFSHMRSMHQLEMDGQAKEIFVAAQNHLALAESQGYLGMKTTDEGDKFGTLSTLTFTAADGTVKKDDENGVYYFVVGDGEDSPDDDTVLNQMLPFASVDETARSGGSYVIRYQKSPATILDVFYVSTSGRYSLEGGFSDSDYDDLMKNYRDDGENDRKKARRDDYNGGDTVLGYYGGETALNTPKGEPLVPPVVELVNAETLYVTVTDYNPTSDQHEVTLVVKGKTSLKEASFSVTPGTTGQDFILDEVTGAYTAHFAMNSSLNGFVPGEDIAVYAIAYNNHVLTNIAQSGTQETNSLFASYDGTNTVEIANIRHLLNLHGDVSNIGAKNSDNKSITVKKAVQTADLLWDTAEADDGGFKDVTGGSISNLTGNVTTGAFLPVVPNKSSNSYALQEYDGGGYKITGVRVNISGDAGLFASLSSCSVHDLELEDFNITGTGNAGALVGTASNSTITGVLVHNDTANGKNDSALCITGVNAGGLVGSMTGGSVQASAAAVYVKATTGDAGGLIGTASNGSVESSYAGGHTVEAKYLTETGDTTPGRVNVIGGASAGGLIGSASVTGISNSYTTASVKGATPGGFIGTRSGGTINNVYASGLVISSATDGKPYPFIGNGGNEQTGITNASYLLGVTTVVVNDQSTVSGITPVSSGVTGTAFSPATKASAVVYDTTLGVQYAFKTVDQLGGSVKKPGITDRHYGDWQLPSLTDLNYVLKNNDPVTTTTLYTEIKLESTTQLVTLALQGETSKNVRLFVLNVTRDSDGKVTAVAVKSESGVDTANSSNNWQKTSGCTALPITFTTGSTTPTVTITLDSITAANGHFAQLFANGSDAKLIPGENITLYVRGGEGVWDEVATLEREETKAGDKFGVFNPYAKVDNSLFAFAFTKAAGGDYVSTSATDNISNTIGSANIKEFRHLQNLDYTVSNVDNSVTTAKLLNNLNWNTVKDYYPTITSISNKTVTDSFCGIYTKALTEFDGNNKTISNLVVDGSKMGSDFTDKGLYSAGLFRYVESGLTVKNLHLVKPIITAGGDATTIGNAGAVAGEVVSTASLTIDTVLAEPGETVVPAAQMTVSASVGAAGGLVGLGKGVISINNSAAVVLVNGGTAAGGLVGSSEASVTLTASYVGGHTEGGQYSKTNWNITSSDAAGGLIGKMAGSAAITDSFTTASVSADAGKAGGLVGVSTGSFTALDYAYTVAPVSGVLSLGSDGSNGALIGSTASNIANGEVFFLPDVYENPLTESGSNNVTVIGTTDKNFTNTSKVHVADIFKKTDPTIMGLTVSGGVTDISKLETHTTTYDSTLTAEYPFKISTQFGDGRHFYGDWVPPVNSESTQFEIHFLIQTPGSNPVDFVMDTGSGVPVSSTTVYAQMEPFTGAQVTVPTMPYKPGYNYGSSDGIVSLSYTNSDPLANTATACVWQVYIGDQTEALKGGSTGGETGARYSRNGGSINLSEDDLRAALPAGAASGDLTLVAYYYQLKNQYSFTLLDYNPAEGVPANDEGYNVWGGLQYVNEPGFNGTEGGTLTELCYKNVYKYDGNDDFNAAYGNLIIPKLNVTGYTFLGWFNGPGDSASPVFSCKNGQINLETPNDEISGPVKLYAHYRKNEKATITLSFVLVQGTQTVPLSTEFTLKFDKSLGFDQDIDLPGYNSASGVTGLKVVKTTGTQDTTILDLSSGGSPATSQEVWFNRLKEKQTDADGNEVEVVKDTDRSVHIRTGVLDSYADKYTVYFQGNVETVGVVVMHELDHTKYTSATNSYSYDDATYYEKFDELLVLQGNPPKINDHPEWYPEFPLNKNTLAGFEEPRLQDVFIHPYSSENAAKYGVTSSTVSGKNIAYIVVVPYERSKYELRFVNLGMSQSDPKFQWKTLYVGETITLPQTSATSPQLYGNNYTFKGWQYEYEDGSLITQKPDEMPDHNLVLRAQYDGQPVDYTVLVWVENPDPDEDGNYSYSQVGRKVITGGAYPDEIIKVSSDDGEVYVRTDRIAAQPIQIGNIVDEENFKLSDYIEYDHSDANVKANGRGTTKINVYYNRKSYVLRFDVGFSVATGSASYQPITEHVEGDVYGDIGTGTSHNYVPLTKIGDNWYYTDNTNGAYFGETGDTYFPLRLENVPTDIYKAAHRYQSTTEDGDVRFGVDTSGDHGEFKRLIVEKETEGEALQEKTVYLLTNTVSAGNEYLIVSRNTSGKGYALTYTTSGNNATPGAQEVNVLAADDRITVPYIEFDGISARTKWTTSGNIKFSNKPGNTTYYLRRNNNDDLSITNNNNNNTWTWSGTNNRLYYTTGWWNSTDHYLRYNNGFSLTTAASSVYLYVKTTIPGKEPQTVYHYYLSEEDKQNNIEYDDTLYVEQNNNLNGAAYEYTTDDLVEHNGELCYLDMTGTFGRADTYIPTVLVRTDTTPTYFKESDGSKYEGTVYKFTVYSKQLYQSTQAQTYYVSQVSDSRSYQNFLSTSGSNSIQVGTTNPFNKTTSKVYSKNSYHGSYKVTGTNYTVYYWDIVAKYGANIIDNWPDTFDARNGNRFIGWLSDNRSYYRWHVTDGTIKDRVDTISEKYILNSTNGSNGNGPYTAKSVKMNPDGTYTYGKDDVAHEFICRYHTTQQNYVYRYYFYDPDEEKYPDFDKPDLERVVYSQAGYIKKAKVGDFDGYYQVERWALTSYNINNKKNPDDAGDHYYSYSIPLVLSPGSPNVTGTVMLFYFKPLQHDIHFEYTGDLMGPISGIGGNGVIEDVEYSKTISGYAYNTIPGLNNDEYSWDGNWYDNEDLNYDGDPFFKKNDATFNSTRKMPNSELTLYARVTHKPVTVTLDLGTAAEGETVTMNGSGDNYVNSAWPWQDPVSDLLLADSGGFKAEFTPVRTAPEDADYTWEFVGWSTVKTGATKDDEYVYAQPQLTALTLYPIWEKADKPAVATVYITYQYYDENTKSYVNFEAAALPASAVTTVTVHPNDPTAQIMVGDYFSMTAPELDGYTAVTASVGPVLVNAEEFKDQVVFKYRKTSWDITVNYYVQFTSVEPEKWLDADTDEDITEGTSPKGPVVATATVHADSEYYLMGYEVPTGSGLGWLNNYRFNHYIYDGQPCYSEFVTVHPDPETNSATVEVYLTPDTDGILIPDLVCPYIGESYATYSAGNPIDAPASVGICQIHYVYYDADGKKLEDADVVNAGAYGVRAYITVSAGGGNYLIWQSVGATPPLHLYIQRRVVILYSAIAEKAEDGNVLQDPTVYYRPFTSAMAASSNEAKAKIARYYDPNDEAHYLGLQDYVSAADPGNAGFIAGDDKYFEWEFSASSFRLEKGTSLNIFTYKVTDAGKALGMENNYYFYVCFGTLTVR